MLSPKETAILSKRSSNSHRKRGNSTFFACYLLHSLLPGSTASYIGFTVNPCRGLRQHNGEIQNGASQTKKKRPWEMIMCVYGFPSKVSALQFKWAWKHPSRSVALKKAAACIEPSLRGIARKIKLLYTMLTHPNWESLNLTVNFLSTKHIKHTEDCFPLPRQMQVRTCSLDELPCYTDTQLSDSKDDIARGEHSADNKDDISRGEHSSDNKDDIARGQHSSSKSATMDPE